MQNATGLPLRGISAEAALPCFTLTMFTLIWDRESSDLTSEGARG